LSLYLDAHPLVADAIVVELGATFLKVIVAEIGQTMKVFIDECTSHYYNSF